MTKGQRGNKEAKKPKKSHEPAGQALPTAPVVVAVAERQRKK
ncbi:hypothetical protein [Ideonella sp. A 288]|nr:hypothetical protein [Ideonella sp. A 288]